MNKHRIHDPFVNMASQLKWKGTKLLVVLNYSAKPAKTNTGIDLSKVKKQIGNYTLSSGGENLQPYEAAVYQL